MRALFALGHLVMASSLCAQTNQLICRRAVGHTCGYERIFMEANSLMTQHIKTLKSVHDPAALHLDAGREALFLDDTKERTNAWGHTLLRATRAKIVITSPENAILPDFEIGNLLRGCTAIPKATWLRGCVSRSSAHYVVEAEVESLGNITVDLRPSGFAVVFFGDETYSCIADPSHSCVGYPRGDTTLGEYTGKHGTTTIYRTASGQIEYEPDNRSQRK